MDTQAYKRFIYWIPADKINTVKETLQNQGYKLHSVLGSQCEVLKAKDNSLGYGSPDAFNRLCKRQGSWYRESDKANMHVIASDHELPGPMHDYLDAIMTESDFQPENLPDADALKKLIASEAYQTQKPHDWEKTGIKDRVLFKSMFTVTGFWKWGDNLDTAWLNHRANHANFLAKQVTTELDGEAVAYTVSENDKVCSSCAEFLNIVSNDDRKLVRACPGSITLAGAKRDVYYDVRPVTYFAKNDRGGKND